MAGTRFRTILITGASGGLGSAIAGHYADASVRLVLGGRDKTRLGQLAENCRAAGAEVRTGFAEVTDAGAMADWIKSADEERPIDLAVCCAGISGETSAGGRRRIDWLLRQPVAVLVIELGANDGLRGLDVGAMRANLQGIIDRTRSARPEARIVLVGMRAHPNLGMTYTEAFERVFRELAADNELALVPFLLDGVGGNPMLNQPDGIHPTAEGHRIVARTVWRVLADVAREVAADAPSGGS